MRRTWLVALVLLPVVGCAGGPPAAERAGPPAEGSFLVELPGGVRYRITPDLPKLKELGPIVLSPPRGVSLEREFQRVAAQRILAASRRGLPLDVRSVVFAELRERDESGQCLPPIEFKVGDYALVEALN